VAAYGLFFHHLEEDQQIGHQRRRTLPTRKPFSSRDTTFTEVCSSDGQLTNQTQTTQCSYCFPEASRVRTLLVTNYKRHF
jgi:ribosomal protein L37E